MRMVQALSPAWRPDLIVLYFDGSPVDCPRCCRARVRFRQTETADGWRLGVTCPRCGLQESLDWREDPLVGNEQLLKWAGWESPLVGRIVERYARRQPNPCPACHAPIRAKEIRTAAGLSVQLRCSQCRQAHTHRPGRCPGAVVSGMACAGKDPHLGRRRPPARCVGDPARRREGLPVGEVAVG